MGKAAGNEIRLSFRDRKAFRDWLFENNDSVDAFWMEFYKDGTPCITYDDALEEALCFGWIDSLIKRVDERIYVQKFSVRRKNSKWSERNKELVAELIGRGLMTDMGLRAVDTAKGNGQWHKQNNRAELEDTDGFRAVLDPSLAAKYDTFSDSLKRHYAGYYFDAKQEETRKSRLKKIVEYMKNKKRLM